MLNRPACVRPARVDPDALARARQGTPNGEYHA
jgi:hypothetical protein